MRPLGPGDPATIGRYRILGILGSGGMGCVYLGRNSGGRIVAVKVVRPDLAGDTKFRARFRREVAAARRVAGPYTVPVFDADVDGPHPWLATGYVSGPSLADAVEEYGPLPEPSLRTLAVGLARALVDVHATGMVHRDLKPSNVLLAVDGPRVIDFGIARAGDETALTTAGMIVGSPGYMSPEQITGGFAGPAGDVFALGGLLAYAGTGTAPFGTGDSASMLWRVVREEPRLDGVSDALRPLLAACLAKDPEDRPTPADLVQRFAALDRPDPRGWLPGPIVQDIGRRAGELPDLEPAAPSHRPDIAETVIRSAHRTAREESAAGASVPDDRHAATVAAAPPRRGGRAPIIAAAAAAVLLAAGVIGGVIAYTGAANSGRAAAITTKNPGARTAGAAAPPSTSSALPGDFVGIWKGSATDGTATFDVVVTLRGGRVGDELGTASTTGRARRGICKRAETLTAVGDSSVTLRARPVDDAPAAKGCSHEGRVSTLKLGSDGTITYRTAVVADMTGILRRAS